MRKRREREGERNEEEEESDREGPPDGGMSTEVKMNGGRG